MDATLDALPPDDESLRPGELVDQFRIDSLLGQGGMGSVYKAFDTRLERWVALKRIALPAGARRAELLARFEREARLLSTVNHPNVAQVYSNGRHEGRPYYAMELVEGRSLAEILAAAGRISGSHCLDYLLQAARGLEAAFAQGVVHRDIKPSNLMLDGEGRLKIVDFGLARRLADDSSLTASDHVLGTPRYMSPEQALALEIDQRSDIYALGATFYHLFAGTPPFESDTPLGLLLQHLQAPLPPLRERNPRVPAPVAEIVERMLAKEPDDRYPTYRELEADLERVLAGQPPLPSAAAPALADTGGASGFRQPPATAPRSEGSGSSPSALSVPRGATQWLLPIAVALGAVLLFLLARDRPGAQGESEPAPRAPTARPTALAPTATATPGASPLSAPGLRALLSGPLAGTVALPAQVANARVGLRRLALAIEAYTADRNEPPPDLVTLREALGIHPRELFDPWGAEIRYEATWEGGYRLLSLGPDGEADTEDDLVLENGRFLI